jgi:hypothetical protein
VAQVPERHVRVATRFGKPVAQRVRSDWLRRPGGRQRRCTRSAEAPDKFARAFVRAGARTTPSPSRFCKMSSLSDSLVGLCSRPAPRRRRRQTRTCISSALKSTSSARKASNSPLRTPVPAVCGYIFGYIHTGSRALATPTHCCDQDFLGGGEGTRTLEPPDCQVPSGCLRVSIQACDMGLWSVVVARRRLISTL